MRTPSFLGAAAAVLLSVNINAQSPATGTINGHDYVDLGLSVKWTVCNIGADKPEDYGDYFAWGEAETKLEYTEKNSATYDKDNFTFHDAAAEKWGGSWRMPTEVECQELIDNCIWKWISVDGYNGYMVTSEKNGNSIFLPAAGGYYNTQLYFTNESGSYNSSSPGENDRDNACVIGFHRGDHDVCWSARFRGVPIRPVTE